jgi:hypothetical protein
MDSSTYKIERIIYRKGNDGFTRPFCGKCGSPAYDFSLDDSTPICGPCGEYVCICRRNGEYQMTWQHREVERFRDGTYKDIPIDLPYPTLHFVHRAIKSEDLTMIAYTPNEEYGKADRQVQIRLGKYLKKVWPDMPDTEVQEHTVRLRGIISSEGVEYTLSFAKDRDTIDRIFETEMYACNSTSISCMHGKFTEWEHRPYHVYANSPDVAVAYLSQGESILARSVVSTKNSAYVRLYSVDRRDCLCSHLRIELEKAGYRHGTLEGSRLTKLPSRSRVEVLPYIDPGGQWVTDEGEYWKVTGNSIGYANEHTQGETLDTVYLESLIDRLCSINLESLPTVRDCLDFEDEWLQYTIPHKWEFEMDDRALSAEFEMEDMDGEYDFDRKYGF